MRRLGTFALVLGIVLAALPAAVPVADTRAQETAGATPATPGVRFEPVAGGAISSLGAASAGLQLDWARFDPGARYAIPPDNPSPLLVAVASGVLTVRSSAPLVVTRAKATEGTRAVAQEEVAAETEISLGPGDAFVRPFNSRQELGNSGGEPAVALLASVVSNVPLGTTSAAFTPVAAPAVPGMVLALALVVAPQCPAGATAPEIGPVATPGGGGGGGGAGGVAVAIAAAPECVGAETAAEAPPAATPRP